MKTYYWHVHHDEIVEPSNDIEVQKEYVRNHKPANEVAIRLRLMTPVEDQDFVSKAWKEYSTIWDKAWEEYNAICDKARKEYEAIEGKTWEEYESIEGKAQKDFDATCYKAWKEYDAIADKARQDYHAKLESQHKKEHPDCPWNGKTIFPEKRTD